MLRPLALLITLAAPALHAQLVRYAPGEYRYAVVNVIKRSDVRGDSRQEYTMTASQTMALLLAPRGTDSLRLRLTLESNALKSDLPIQLPHVERMNGTVVDGVMTSSGRVIRYSHHSPDSEGLEVTAVADNMSRFLLWVKANAAVGKPVTDTTSSRETDGGNDVTERTVTTTTILGDTLYAGQKAWRIRRDTEVQVAGVLMQEGQALQESGGGTGTGTFYVTESGVYLGSKTQSATTTALKLPDGTTITSALIANSSVTLLK